MPPRIAALCLLAHVACAGDPGRPASPWMPGASSDGSSASTFAPLDDGGASDDEDASADDSSTASVDDDGAASSSGAGEAGSDSGGVETTSGAGTTGDQPGSVWAGLEQDGSQIPRAGLANPTLEATLGEAVEPYGDVVDVDGEAWVQGTLSWFGGPDDTGVGPDETGAITGEILRELNDPLDPSPEVLAANLDDYYYVAMRWSYSPNGPSFWADARLVVRNPQSGAAIVVRPVDWGPNTSTGRIIDLSPQSLVDLGLQTDDDVQVAFAVPGTPLGPVPP